MKKWYDIKNQMLGNRERSFRQVRLFLVWLALFIPLQLFGSLSHGVMGQSLSEDVWKDPNILSTYIKYPTRGPKIVADNNGSLHVFFVSYSGSISDFTSLNTIYYMTYDGLKWSEPNAVVVAAHDTNSLQLHCVVVDSLNRIYLTFQDAGKVKVAWSDAKDAYNPRKWRVKEIDNGSYSFIGLDETQNKIYLVYARQATEIVLTSMERDEQKWSLPVIVWRVDQPVITPGKVALFVDTFSIVHMVWSEHFQGCGWGGGAIWYAKYNPGLEKVEILKKLAQSDCENVTIDWPLVVGKGGEIHVFWNNGIGSSMGRFHYWSLDSGLTWQSENIFPGLSGQTGYPAVAFDSLANLHYFTSAAGFGYKAGIWHAVWKDGSWSELESVRVEDFQGERPSIVITGGNKLHVVWDNYTDQDVLAGDIVIADAQVVYTWKELSVPLENKDLGLPTPSTIGKDFASTEQSAPEDANITQRNNVFDGSDLQLQSSLWPILWGFLSSGLLVIAVLILGVYRK